MSGETMLKRWSDFRPTKTQAFWFAAGAVLLVLLIGFGPGGWVSGGTAKRMVDEAAGNARLALAVAVCKDQFMEASGAKARLAKLEAASWLERGDFVAQGGWATMPDRKAPNNAVAAQCAAHLLER